MIPTIHSPRTMGSLPTWAHCAQSAGIDLGGFDILPSTGVFCDNFRKGIGGSMQGGEPFPESLQIMLPGQHIRLLSQQTPCMRD